MIEMAKFGKAKWVMLLISLSKRDIYESVCREFESLWARQ
jgi:hypothetical protein